MTPAQYNELMRQADVLDKDKENKEFQELWEQFTIDNPNTVGGFQEQFVAFKWLFKMLVTDRELWINRHIR